MPVIPEIAREVMEYPGRPRSRVRAIIEDELFIGYRSEEIYTSSFAARRSTYIISARREPLHTGMMQSEYTHVYNPVEDHGDAGVFSWLPHAVRFIDRALHSGGSVLMYNDDDSTLSREAVVAAAYLIYSRQMSTTEAMDLVHRADRWASPGHALCQQLVLFAQYYSPRPRRQWHDRQTLII
ncbi:phosphatases II [Dentipellis sp. KUC8613]|nr:phosphatases II [Dentipellis sp. KUC8613]